MPQQMGELKEELFNTRPQNFHSSQLHPASELPTVDQESD